MSEFAELAPLALEKTIIGCVILLTAVVVLGSGVNVLQRRHHLSNAQALTIFLTLLAAVVALLGYFQLAERFAPDLTPFMGLIDVMGVLATATVWTLGLYVLLGGKLPRNKN